jgi:dihydroflavonol-4-reductase
MILVTGATGHIGNVLIRKLLDQGEKVRALIWRGEDTTPLKGLDVEQVVGDILDPASLEPAMHGVETVYHLAGIISIMPGRNPLVWRVNVEGTRNVLEAARHARIRRLVYTSSIHAIARAPHGVMMDESLGFDQNNPYGEYDRSKAAASLEVQKQLPLVWTRSSSVQPALSVLMISAVQRWARSSAAHLKHTRCSTSKAPTILWMCAMWRRA